MTGPHGVALPIDTDDPEVPAAAAAALARINIAAVVVNDEVAPTEETEDAEETPKVGEAPFR